MTGGDVLVMVWAGLAVGVFTVLVYLAMVGFWMWAERRGWFD